MTYAMLEVELPTVYTFVEFKIDVTRGFEIQTTYLLGGMFTYCLMQP